MIFYRLWSLDSFPKGYIIWVNLIFSIFSTFFYDFSGLNMRGSMLSLSTNGGDNLSVSSSSQSHSQLQVNNNDAIVCSHYYRLFWLRVMHIFVNLAIMQRMFIWCSKDVHNKEIKHTISRCILLSLIDKNYELLSFEITCIYMSLTSI